jgi:hypothetical protein
MFVRLQQLFALSLPSLGTFFLMTAEGCGPDAHLCSSDIPYH